MDIAVDFDDVVVDTMELFLKDWNSNIYPFSASYMKRNQITNWNLPVLLGVRQDFIRGIYDRLDYADVTPIAGAVQMIHNLRDQGHSVIILTASDRGDDIRKWMSENGLQQVALFDGVGHKAGWCRDNGIDLLVDDRPSYLKGAVTVGVHAVKFYQPWNQDDKWGSQPYEHTARNWEQVDRIVQELSQAKILEAVSKMRLGQMQVVGSVKVKTTRDEVNKIIDDAVAALRKLRLE